MSWPGELAPSRPATYPRALSLEDRKGRQMTTDDSTKRAALRLLRRGQVTQSEAARLAGVSRQLMRHWARAIDVDAAREAMVARLWQRAILAPK
jgi:predicted DNA-binding protein (UPF0251 family)